MKKYIYLDMDGTMTMIYKDANFLTNMYKKNFFKELEPYLNMLMAVRIMIKSCNTAEFKEAIKSNYENDLEIVFKILTKKNESKYCEFDKNLWIESFLPEIQPENRIFVDCDKDKAEYIKNLNKDCILIDDHTPNLLSWVESGGKGIKFVNEINRQNNRWKGNLIHYQMSPNVIIENILLSL